MNRVNGQNFFSEFGLIISLSIFMKFGIRVAEKGSWKNEKLESWKIRHDIEKNEVGKFAPKLESTSWK